MGASIKDKASMTMFVNSKQVEVEYLKQDKPHCPTKKVKVDWHSIVKATLCFESHKRLRPLSLAPSLIEKQCKYIVIVS